jgi:hypothetical protein
MATRDVAHELSQLLTYSPSMAILANDTGRGMGVRRKRGQFPRVVVGTNHVATRAVVGCADSVFHPECHASSCQAHEENDAGKHEGDLKEGDLQSTVHGLPRDAPMPTAPRRRPICPRAAPR